MNSQANDGTTDQVYEQTYQQHLGLSMNGPKLIFSQETMSGYASWMWGASTRLQIKNRPMLLLYFLTNHAVLFAVFACDPPFVNTETLHLNISEP